MVIFVIIEILEKRSLNINIHDAILTPKHFLDFSILIIYCYTFIIKIFKCNQNDQDFFSTNSQYYIDTYRISEDYNSVFKIESLILILMTFKILILLKINQKINLLYTINELAIKIFSRYLLFFLPILIGFACVAQNLWGPYINKFRTFGNSFVQILVMTTGYIDIISMLTYKPIMGIIFFTLFFVFVLFFMYAVFISIYAESYRKTVIELGYPEDQIEKEWSLKDYVIWLCYCVGGKKTN